MFDKINGRFKTRSGQMVAVHDSVGHPILDDGTAVPDMKITYDAGGNCEANIKHDLMESFDHGASQKRMTVKGCPICEKENP